MRGISPRHGLLLMQVCLVALICMRLLAASLTKRGIFRCTISKRIHLCCTRFFSSVKASDCRPSRGKKCSFDRLKLREELRCGLPRRHTVPLFAISVSGPVCKGIILRYKRKITEKKLRTVEKRENRRNICPYFRTHAIIKSI